MLNCSKLFDGVAGDLALDAATEADPGPSWQLACLPSHAAMGGQWKSHKAHAPPVPPNPLLSLHSILP